MAPFRFSSRETVARDVIITALGESRVCGALIDADCLYADSVPKELAGVLDIPKSEWEFLASAEHLVLTLQQTGEPYRMILDAITGRFLARQL